MKIIRQILGTINNKLNGISYEPSDRNNLSAALYYVSIGHARSIILLIQNQHFSSSYALIRPMFESFIRAAWIQKCASENEIKKLIKKDEFPLRFGEMIHAVEEKQGWEKTLSNIKKVALNSMHSYTHGGMKTITRCFHEEELLQKPDQNEINEIFKFVALLSFLSFSQIIDLAKINENDSTIEELYSLVCKKFLN